jgi:hypothetical protein
MQGAVIATVTVPFSFEDELEHGSPAGKVSAKQPEDARGSH